jgi:hypothetical protein
VESRGDTYFLSATALHLRLPLLPLPPLPLLPLPVASRDHLRRLGHHLPGVMDPDTILTGQLGGLGVANVDPRTVVLASGGGDGGGPRKGGSKLDILVLLLLLLDLVAAATTEQARNGLSPSPSAGTGELGELHCGAYGRVGGNHLEEVGKEELRGSYARGGGGDVEEPEAQRVPEHREDDVQGGVATAADQALELGDGGRQEPEAAGCH